MMPTTGASPVWQFRLASTSCEIDLTILAPIMDVEGHRNGGGAGVRLREPLNPTSCRKTQRLRRGDHPNHTFPTEREGNSNIKSRDSRRRDAKTQPGMHDRTRTRHRRGRGGGPRELRELHHTATDEPKAGKTRPSDATKS